MAPEDERPAAWWLEQVLREERRGELLLAFDLAERGLAQHPGDVALKHRAVLALARAGDTAQAAARFGEYGLASVLDEDVAALGARIAKDVALAADGEERARLAAAAAEEYRGVYERTGGYYPAVNAATLWLVAGDRERSRALARAVLELVAGDGSYYATATAAEAHLLLGDEPSARAALARAAELHGGDHGAVATTRRQLRLVCALNGFDPALLGVLAGPPVVHFCGHRIAAPGADGRFAAEAETATAARIAEVVDGLRPGYAYGALAAGADLMWAEALLARGWELHAVLPFALAEFVEQSVRPSGEEWIARFEQCLAAATAVTYATDDAFLGDDVLFRYGTELAMGLALLRARYLEADVQQLAVWDGGAALGDAGTAIDVATWRRLGGATTVVRPQAGALPPGPAQRAADSPRREVRAMLFGDVRGFSKLTDEQLPVFSEKVLGAFAEVVRRHAAEVRHRNTWGDGLYVVLTGVAAAARCALDLQDAMTRIDLEGAGLPPHLALRLGGHVGPIFPTRDPVREAPTFMGSHVSRTARIEPVTPAGGVYVTEPFAAALVLGGTSDFTCEYVGHMPAAKDYGLLRMYRLRRTPRVGPG